MSAIPGNSSSALYESFHNYFENWLVQQNQYRQDLISGLQHWENNKPPGADDGILYPLIIRVLEHYKEYYRTKSMSDKLNVWTILTQPWRSTFEKTMLWIGGWKPNMAFVLLYTEAVSQYEARSEEWMQGVTRGDLADLTVSQYRQVDQLQQRTTAKENKLSGKFAKLQESGADKLMVNLSHEATKSDGVEEEPIEQILWPEEDKLDELLDAADALRMKTLTRLMEILSPTQCVHYLVAAAELHIKIHEWGKKMDQRFITSRQN